MLSQIMSQYCSFPSASEFAHIKLMSFKGEGQFIYLYIGCKYLKFHMQIMSLLYNYLTTTFLFFSCY